MIRGFWAGSKLDLKLGMRMLLRHPGLSLVSVIGMAVAIAIASGYFTALGALLETELPIPYGDRIVAIRHQNLDRGGDAEPALPGDLLTWREQLTSVEDLAAFREVNRNLIFADGRTEVVAVAAISANGFSVPRVAPILGRPLLPADEHAGAAPVLVIGHDAWQHGFAGAPDIIGRTVRLGEVVHTVVGVMPGGFAFPIRDQYWIPLRIGAGDRLAPGEPLIVFGRLADGVSIARARAELAAIGERTAAAAAKTHQHLRPQVLPFTHSVMGIEGPEMELALRGVRLLISLLLIIVAVNVAVLLYARTATRVGEIAVRSALGASRRRIVGQLFVEAAVLATAAALVGFTLARVTLGIISAALESSPDARLPFWIDFGLSPGQLSYVALLTLLASAIVGVVPALKVTRRQGDALRNVATRGPGLELGRTWTALVVTQVALAVAALPPALGYAGEALALATRKPAAAAAGLLRATLVVPEDASRTEELIRRLEADPGVIGVTHARAFPGAAPWAHVQTEDGAMGVATNRVGVDLLEVLQVPLLAGRGFLPGDAVEGARAVLVDDAFASRLGGGNVIGRRLRYAPADGAEASEWYEIVGLVPSFAHEFTVPYARGVSIPQVFHAAPAITAGSSALIIRVQGNPASSTRRITELVAAVDPRMRVEELQPFAAKWRSDQGVYWLLSLGIAATMASVLMLSAAGIYALMSFTVAKRRREIGIRTALGANVSSLLAGIFARAGVQLGAGVLAGLAAAMAIELSTPGLVLAGRGSIILPTVIALVLAVGFLAALGPARRGLSVQPAEVLRDEG